MENLCECAAALPFDEEELSTMKELLRLDEVRKNVFIYQYKSGFSYGTDAVLLAAFTRFRRGARGCEIGCGSGAVSVLAASCGEPEKIFAFEIQEKYARLAASNAERSGLTEKIEVIWGDVRNGSAYLGEKHGLFSALDFVFSNPPYMKMTSGYLNASEEKRVARHETAGTIEELCAAASRMLKNGGDFFCVYRPDRTADLICAMRSASIEPKSVTFCHSRPGAPASLVLVRGEKGAACSLCVERPLYIYAGEKGSEYSEDMKKITEGVWGI